MDHRREDVPMYRRKTPKLVGDGTVRAIIPYPARSLPAKPLRTCFSQMKAGGTRGAIDAEFERSQAFDVSEAQGEGMDQPNGA